MGQTARAQGAKSVFQEEFGNQPYLQNGSDPTLLTLVGAVVDRAPQLANTPLALHVAAGHLEAEDIRQLQRYMIAQGHPCGPTGVDGKYGPNTHAALMAMLMPSSGPTPAPAPEPPVVVEAPSALDSESPNIEGVASAPLMEKPTDVHQAQEQIERMSLVRNGGSEAVSAMQDALKMLPKDSPDYEHFRKTVDNYQPGQPSAPTLDSPAVSVPVSANPEPVTVASLPPQAPAAAAPAPVTAPAAPQGELPEDPDGPPVGFY
jgi:hypothetical protein